MRTATLQKLLKTLAEATDDKEAVTTDVNVYTGKFDGDKPITREEMAAIAVEAYNVKLPSKERRTSFLYA